MEAGLFLPDPGNGFSQEEAMFLQEHSCVFKSDRRFHVEHAPWRTITSDAVKECYGPLLERLTAESQ